MASAPSNAQLMNLDELRAFLVTTWTDVLGVQREMISKSFYDLGGESVHAAEIIARIESQTGATIGLGQFLSQPSIDQMIELIQAQGRVRPRKSA